MFDLSRYHQALSSKAHPVDAAELRIAIDGNIAVQYAPFDHIQDSARIGIVGITPGRFQATAALEELYKALRNGNSLQQALRLAKGHASFSGPMRKNLVAMLDHIGIAKWMGIPTTSSLWLENTSLVHFTSILRFPVFVNGENYSGSSPGMLSTPILRSQIKQWFCEELRILPDVLWIPLGDKVTEALRFAASEASVNARILTGLPHPSGANAERIAYFLGNKPANQLSAKTNPHRIDSGRAEALRIVAALRA